MCLLDWNGNWLFIIEGVGVACGDWRVVVVSGSRSFDDVGSYTVHPKGLDMSNAIFDCPDLSAFTRLDDLGLEVMGQRMWPDHAVLACRIVGEDRWCRRCGCQGVARDTVVRRLAHEPYGWRPTIVHVSVRRYRCQECAHVWRQDTSQAAQPRAKLSRSAVRWALTGLVVHHVTVARIAQALGVSWNTANTAVLGEGQRLLINDPTRFDGMRVIGVDEHVWHHNPYGDKNRHRRLVRDSHPRPHWLSRLLDMVPGRSKQVFKTWLAAQPDTWRERIEIVAMDGFTGFKSPDSEELPGAWVGHGTSLQGPEDVTHQILPAPPTPTTPDPRPVRQRGAHRTRGHLEHLPEHH